MKEAGILDLAEDLVEDQDLSDEDTEQIIEAVREHSKKEALTHDEIHDLLDLVSSYTHDLEFKRTPLAFKVLGIVMCIVGCVQIFTLGTSIYTFFSTHMLETEMTRVAINTLSVSAVSTICILAGMVIAIIVGFRLIHGHRGEASKMILVSMGFTVVTMTCELMNYGVSIPLFVSFLLLIAQTFVAGYLNPSLRNQTTLSAALHQIYIESHAKRGTLGLSETGKGYIHLDFFNLFWTFVVCCVLGLIVEIIFHMIFIEPGVYQDRAGLLFGPFSPIYGVGGVLMTVILNRFKDKNIILIFIACTIIGGAFEFFTSVFMEVAFGTIAWDYSFLPTGALLGGRTCLLYASMFGVLGVLWIKWLLPLLLKFINLMPWRIRGTVTLVCAALMLVNGLMTFQALDDWGERMHGKVPVTPSEIFYAEVFGDEFMQNRFQSMEMK